MLEWMKIDTNSTSEQSMDVFCKILYTDMKESHLSAPAKEMPVQGTEGKELQGLAWTDYTAICIEKGQSAVLVNGDKIIGYRAAPGLYLVRCEEDLSKAKVYFVRTELVSSKVYESNTAVVYPARDPIFGVEQDIRIRSALYFNYRIKKPKDFFRYFTNVKNKRVVHQTVDAELYGVFSACLQDVLKQLSAENVPYDQLTAQTERLTELMSERLKTAWNSTRGIELKCFAFLKADPYKVDEKAFLDLCQEAANKDDVTSEAFSEEFGKLLQGLGQVAGEALNAFQGEMASIFSDLAESLDRELQTEGEDDEDFDSLLDSILNGPGMDVMGTWDCPELKQSVTFALLDAAIETDGREVWRGDWEEKQDADGKPVIVCPTADTLGCYAYFAPSEDGEYLAGVLSDTGEEKQYVRFVKRAK